MNFELKRKSVIVIIASIFVASCSVTLPVRGQLEKGSEMFTGLATGYLDGSGNLHIVSDKGSDCSGNFVYITRRKGEGVFTCTDGRSGPFSFVSTGQRGIGTGQIGDEEFTFTFGDF